MSVRMPVSSSCKLRSLLELGLVCIPEMFDFGMTHRQQVLQDLLLLVAVDGTDYVQNLAGADEVVGCIGVCGVDAIARLDLVVEEVVLQQNNEPMTKLSGGEGGVLEELWDRGTAFVQEGREDALWEKVISSGTTTMRISRTTYGWKLSIYVIREQSAKLRQILGL